MAILVKRFCFHKLLIALLKLSPPGMVILSPTVSPEMEVSNASSKYLVPVIFIPATIYSLGDFEFDRARRSGSTDNGCVVSVISWALTVLVINKKQKVGKKTQVNNLRCIQSVF